MPTIIHFPFFLGGLEIQFLLSVAVFEQICPNICDISKFPPGFKSTIWSSPLIVKQSLQTKLSALRFLFDLVTVFR